MKQSMGKKLLLSDSRDLSSFGSSHGLCEFKTTRSGEKASSCSMEIGKTRRSD